MRIDARDAPDAPRTNSVLLHWEISLCVGRIVLKFGVEVKNGE